MEEDPQNIKSLYKMASSEGKQNTKKKGYFVPSRYKQAAEKVSIQSSNSGERTYLERTTLKINKDSRRHQVSGNSSQDSTSSSKLSVSEEGRGMTSTPSCKGKYPFPPLDESAVTDSKGYLKLPHLKEGIGPVPSEYLKKNLVQKNKLQNETMCSYGPVVISHKDKRKNESYSQKVAETEIDILYAQFLQAVFLENEARISLELRSSNAVEKIHKLFSLVMLHVDELKHGQSKLQLLSYLIKLYEHCQKQEGILRPLFEIIPSLEKQYRNLAEAVNITRNKLQVKGVILPDPESEGEIIELLENIKDIICDFFEKFSNVKEIITSADILQSYTDIAEDIFISLKSGFDLLSEVDDLLLSEACLKLKCVKL